MFSSQQDTIHAMLAISQALDAARLEEYIRVFVDEGAPMHALLLLARERGVTPAYTEKLLAAFGEQGQRQPPGMTLLVEPLSSREVQVLGLLAGGLSPEQIAEELVITVGTTRNHLHHIYAKLQVKTQLQAVERARELGML